MYEFLLLIMMPYFTLDIVCYEKATFRDSGWSQLAHVGYNDATILQNHTVVLIGLDCCTSSYLLQKALRYLLTISILELSVSKTAHRFVFSATKMSALVFQNIVWRPANYALPLKSNKTCLTASLLTHCWIVDCYFIANSFLMFSCFSSKLRTSHVIYKVLCIFVLVIKIRITIAKSATKSSLVSYCHAFRSNASLAWHHVIHEGSFLESFPIY